MSKNKSRWMRDLHRFLPLKSQFLLSANNKDLQLRYDSNGTVAWHHLGDYLSLELKEYGYDHILNYDPLNGFSESPLLASPAQTQALLNTLNIPADDKPHQHNLENFIQSVENIVRYKSQPIALIANFSSQYLVHPERLVKAEHDAFTRMLVLSQQSHPQPFGTPRKAFYNTILWVVDKEADLPDWMTLNNPKIRHISIGKPDHISRRAIAKKLLESLGGQSESPAFEDALQQFVDETEGLILLDLLSIIDLARSENISQQHIGDAIRRYKVGVTEDPWKKIERDKIRGLTQTIQKRVKGQDPAINHMADILKRAITGISANKRGNRPRGVVFLAGPTGVGKTELAKTITHVLFGDENAYIRFDMSEFSAEHSDQRLIGAPPGYVGYDVGGELTNAVREKPFSVILFDEIEKAHPRILDKFLQILDDGRLTSGRGDPVYFSEALIIFTSNLGIYRTTEEGERVANVSVEQTFSEVQKNIKSEIFRYFKLQLNRPEILNRIGENIIVFDFIRPEVGLLIFNSMLDSILKSIKGQQDIHIHLNDDSNKKLQTLCLDNLSNGGRGIRNQLEIHLINPLSRSLFDSDSQAGDQWEISNIEHSNHQTQLMLEKIE